MWRHVRLLVCVVCVWLKRIAQEINSCLVSQCSWNTDYRRNDTNEWYQIMWTHGEVQSHSWDTNLLRSRRSRCVSQCLGRSSGSLRWHETSLLLPVRSFQSWLPFLKQDTISRYLGHSQRLYITGFYVISLIYHKLLWHQGLASDGRQEQHH